MLDPSPVVSVEVLARGLLLTERIVSAMRLHVIHFRDLTVGFGDDVLWLTGPMGQFYYPPEPERENKHTVATWPDDDQRAYWARLEAEADANAAIARKKHDEVMRAWLEWARGELG